jgi:catechol 2,3-dioxygenase-like lactoylglutathione lyase family enzyme
MRDYRYDHVHLRSPDPDATARFFETMFGAEVTRGVYPPGCVPLLTGLDRRSLTFTTARELTGVFLRS